jgi:hypothetical protein
MTIVDGLVKAFAASPRISFNGKILKKDDSTNHPLSSYDFLSPDSIRNLSSVIRIRSVASTSGYCCSRKVAKAGGVGAMKVTLPLLFRWS